MIEKLASHHDKTLKEGGPPPYEQHPASHPQAGPSKRPGRLHRLKELLHLNSCDKEERAAHEAQILEAERVIARVEEERLAKRAASEFASRVEVDVLTSTVIIDLRNRK